MFDQPFYKEILVLYVFELAPGTAHALTWVPGNINLVDVLTKHDSPVAETYSSHSSTETCL